MGDLRWTREGEGGREREGGVLLTVEGLHVQHHLALPLVGGPLQLGGGLEARGGAGQLQVAQQLVLAQGPVLPRPAVRHVPAGHAQTWTHPAVIYTLGKVHKGGFYLPTFGSHHPAHYSAHSNHSLQITTCILSYDYSYSCCTTTSCI